MCTEAYKEGLQTHTSTGNHLIGTCMALLNLLQISGRIQ